MRKLEFKYRNVWPSDIWQLVSTPIGGGLPRRGEAATRCYTAPLVTDGVGDRPSESVFHAPLLSSPPFPLADPSFTGRIRSRRRDTIQGIRN